MNEQKGKSFLFGCFKSQRGCEILLPAKFFVGKKPFQNTWATIMKNNNHIISLHGRIGVGKTTLLTYLNNQFLRHRSYGFVIYALFSTLSALQGEIALQIGLSSTPGWNEKGFEQKSQAIFNLLSGKRYAILIDDLLGTNVNVLFKMGLLPCPNSKNRCKVVVVVAYNQDHKTLGDTHIRVMPLAWDNAWSLFKHEVLDPKISSLAAQVALLCQGLPKALVKIARLMKYNTTQEEWRSAIQILEKCDIFVLGREPEDLAQILYDELGKNSMFQERVMAQITTMRPASNWYVHDQLCKIGRGLLVVKDNLAALQSYEENNKRIIKKALDIVDGLRSYICES